MVTGAPVVLGRVALSLVTTMVAHTLPVLMAYNDSVGAFQAVFADWVFSQALQEKRTRRPCPVQPAGRAVEGRGTAGRAHMRRRLPFGVKSLSRAPAVTPFGLPEPVKTPN